MLIYKKKYTNITHTNISVLVLKLHTSMLTIQEDNIALYKRHTHKIRVMFTLGTYDMHIKFCSFAMCMLNFALLQCLCLYCVPCILRIDTKSFSNVKYIHDCIRRARNNFFISQKTFR